MNRREKILEGKAHKITKRFHKNLGDANNYYYDGLFNFVYDELVATHEAIQAEQVCGKCMHNIGSEENHHIACDEHIIIIHEANGCHDWKPIVEKGEQADEV